MRRPGARGTGAGDAHRAPPAHPHEGPDRPGTLLRTAPFSGRWVPAGVAARRVLYTTTRGDGVPAVASGLVLVPRPAGPRARPADVVLWAHGVTGVDPASAPSLERRRAASRLHRELLAAGCALVAPDYVGLGTPGPHPLLIGEPTARSVLDAVRAARRLAGPRLSEATVLCGYSQGGHAALWAGGIAPLYAPELDLRGVAALAPVTDLPAVVRNLEHPLGGHVLASYFFACYARHYPDVTYEEYILPSARERVRRTARHGLRAPRTLATVVVDRITGRRIWDGDPDRGALHRRMVENIPVLGVRAPLLLAHGSDDRIVPVASQDAFVRRRRAAGQGVDYRTYPCGHDGPVGDRRLVADVVGWTKEHARR